MAHSWNSSPCRRHEYRPEMALIQEWQPHLNSRFICHFFHPRKNLLHECTIWPCIPLAQGQKRSSLCKLSGSFRQIDFRQAWSMADHPCFGIKYKVLIGNQQDADIDRWRPYPMLHAAPAGCKYSRALYTKLLPHSQSMFLSGGGKASRASALCVPWLLTTNLTKLLNSFLCSWHLQVMP